MADRLIGVDVGGTKISAAVLEHGGLSQPTLYPTDTTGRDALLAQLVRVISAAGRCDAVGIGIPSVVDFATGTVRASVNIPLTDVPLRHLLSDRLGVPVFVDNDATCAALAEASDGERIVVRNLVMLTVGTGVGGGIVVNGRVYRGATGAAGELGHLLIAADVDEGAPPAAGFPHPASLEAVAAGRALDRLAAAHGLADGRAAVEAARGGKPAGVQALRILGERLGIGIANMINAFDPDVVAVGGGVSAAGELLLAPARESAKRFVLPGVGTQTEIRIARHGPVAGVLGAALLAGQELEAQAEVAA